MFRFFFLSPLFLSLSFCLCEYVQNWTFNETDIFSLVRVEFPNELCFCIQKKKEEENNKS